jgi:osmotically-inducible protein OsmY
MHQGETAFDRQDRDVERRVTNFLAQHFPRLRTVEVVSRQGVVTIFGSVNSFYERQLCINCCQRVAGVTGMNDRVEVAQSHSSTVQSSVRRPRIALAS